MKRIAMLSSLCLILLLLPAQDHLSVTKTLVLAHVIVIDSTGAPSQICPSMTTAPNLCRGLTPSR